MDVARENEVAHSAHSLLIIEMIFDCNVYC